MEIKKLQKKSDDDVLLLLKKWFPNVVSFEWGDSDSPVIESENQLKPDELSDIAEYVRSVKVWEWV